MQKHARENVKTSDIQMWIGVNSMRWKVFW